MMTSERLRVVHALASQYQSSWSKTFAQPDFSRILYEKYNNFAELINFLKGVSGATSIPEEKAWNLALKVYDEHEALGIHMIALSDADYPKYLSRIANPPAILFLRGNRSILRDLPGVSVVGTREISASGSRITARISDFLTRQGWVIVSGLARGVDAVAHDSCLNTNGKTIAVLAGGLDQPQPKQNASLGYRILDQGGAWVSEHPVGTLVQKSFFVQRNRIQLGLSAGSVIIEAALHSGTMTQAEFCFKQGRPLFAVVPETDENSLGLKCEGTINMVKVLGAHPLRNKSDYPGMLALLAQQKSMMHSI